MRLSWLSSTLVAGALLAPTDGFGQAPPFACGPDCSVPGRWVLCNDSFDRQPTSPGGLQLQAFLEAACTSFDPPSPMFDVTAFAALFGPGEMVITLVELFEEDGTTAPGSVVFDTGAGIPSSGTTGFSGLFFSGPRMTSPFRLCLRQQLDDLSLTTDIRALLWDADGAQAQNTTFLPSAGGWRDIAADRGDFVLRAIIEGGDLEPWQPGGACASTGTDAGVITDAAEPADGGPTSLDAGAADAGSGSDAATSDDAGAIDVAAPRIDAISPSSGSNVAAVDVIVTGAAFADGASLKIGTISADDVRVPGSTTILAKVPANIATGVWDVIVQNPDGQSAILTGGYTVLGPNGEAPVADECRCERTRASSTGSVVALLAIAAVALARRPAPARRRSAR